MPVPGPYRIHNRVPPADPTDHTALNADILMLVLDGIVDGVFGTTLKIPNWVTSGRPYPPSIGNIGVNTDIGQIEWYDGNEWRILGG